MGMITAGGGGPIDTLINRPTRHAPMQQPRILQPAIADQEDRGQPERPKRRNA